MVPDADFVRDQRESFRFVGVGIQFGFVIILAAFLGAWLDGRFGTSPLLLIIGVFAGFAGAAYSLIKKFTPR